MRLNPNSTLCLSFQLKIVHLLSPLIIVIKRESSPHVRRMIEIIIIHHRLGVPEEK